MIISKEQSLLKAQQQLHALLAYVEQAVSDHQRIDQVEREVFHQLLSLGHSLLEAFVAAPRRCFPCGPCTSTATGTHL